MDSPPGKITLHDIAMMLGISPSTVSRALQNNPRITLKKRKLIQQTAKKIGYQPNSSATALAQQRHSAAKKIISDEIAWLNLWKDPQHLRRHKEFNLYWTGARVAAERCGYRLEEISGVTNLKHIEKILLARNIRGILIPPHGSLYNLTGLRWENFTVVRFGYSVEYPPAPIVTSDHVANTLLALWNIRKQGYQRVGFVTTAGKHTRFKAGFLLGQSDFPPSEQVPMLVLDNLHADKDRLGSWLKKTRPEAILTDIAPIRGALQSLGYRVPEDIGLAALSILDGNAEAGIYQNSEHIGKAAAELLISQLHHNDSGLPQMQRQLLIEGRWINGGSLPPQQKNLEPHEGLSP